MPCPRSPSSRPLCPPWRASSPAVEPELTPALRVLCSVAAFRRGGGRERLGGSGNLPLPAPPRPLVPGPPPSGPAAGLSGSVWVQRHLLRPATGSRSLRVLGLPVNTPCPSSCFYSLQGGSVPGGRAARGGAGPRAAGAVCRGLGSRPGSSSGPSSLRSGWSLCNTERHGPGSE